MPIATVIALVAQYGLPFAQQVVGWVESGKTSVTSADLATLQSLASKQASDYLAAAGGAPAVPKT